MIGVVVVTHGQLATELLNAAEAIVGDLPRFAAVSIGWHDDTDDAREEIRQAIARLQGESGVLLLTDMFGGTPTEHRPVLRRAGPRRGGHGRQPADAHQALEPPLVAGACWRWPASCAKPAGTPSMWRRTCFGPRPRAEMLTRTVTVPNALGHARPRGREVRARGERFACRVSVTREDRRRSRGGRQEHPGPAAARGRQGRGRQHHGRRGRRGRARCSSLCRLVESGFGEDPC